jgi:hypothetical protein
MGLISTSVTGVTKEQWRSKIITELYGRRSGIEKDGYEAGEQDTLLPIDALGTTVNSSLSQNGLSVLQCTVGSSATYTLQTSKPSVYKTISQISSSTLGYVVQFGAADNVVCSAGSSFNQITFQGVGHTVNLQCASTAGSTGGGAIWIATSSPSAGLTFSTY